LDVLARRVTQHVESAVAREYIDNARRTPKSTGRTAGRSARNSWCGRTTPATPSSAGCRWLSGCARASSSSSSGACRRRASRWRNGTCACTGTFCTTGARARCSCCGLRAWRTATSGTATARFHDDSLTRLTDPAAITTAAATTAAAAPRARGRRWRDREDASRSRCNSHGTGGRRGGPCRVEMPLPQHVYRVVVDGIDVVRTPGDERQRNEQG